MALKNYYAEIAEVVVAEFNTSVSNGLSSAVVKERIGRYGLNVLEQKAKKTLWQIFIVQFKSFMIVILLAAAVISGILGELADTIIILAVVILNAVLGTVQENKAEESLAALEKMSAPHAKVIRDGQVTKIEASALVPGDIVILETGDLVGADLRLTEAVNLKIQEAALTGESVPVEKQVNKLNAQDISLGDQVNMAFSGSIVMYGRGQGVVVATGMKSQVGKIAAMLQNVDSTDTPMKRRLESLGKVMGIAVLAICAVIFGIGLLYNNDPFQIFLIAVSLAVAAIPEGLPAIATIVLAIGVQRMVKKNAIIRTLPAVETLGSAGVICSDKTGTLTQNRMTVEYVAYSGDLDPLTNKIKNLDKQGYLLTEAAILCNDAKIVYEDGNVHTMGDPTETALLDMGLKAGQHKNNIEKDLPRVAEIPFDSERKLMTTVHKYQGKYRFYTKGALDELLQSCTAILWHGQVKKITETEIKLLLQTNELMAAKALRVLAMAYKDVDVLPNKINTEFEGDLIFIGMVGMIDPPRPEAKEAVELCRSAGIMPVMITGDHMVTAAAIAGELGILEADKKAISGAELGKLTDEEFAANIDKYAVYARVAPEHKVRIVDAWQKRGMVVAMTGDGVNDAPALKKADIGAAMGITGTDVAKEASDMVLTDDNFATVVSAVAEGRRIYDNILKAIQFLLSCNVGEIFTLFIATMLNWASPLLPIHILWVNLVTDSVSALALGVDPADKNIMRRKPRPAKESIFTRGMVWRVLYQGLMVGVLTISAFQIGNQVNLATGQTMAFSVLAFSQLVHAFNIRSNWRSVFAGGFSGNKYLIGATFISAALMLVVLFIPFLSQAFRLVSLTNMQWLYVLCLSFAPIPIVEIAKLFRINTFGYERQLNN